MILINFTHPLTDAQKKQVEQISGQEIEAIFDSFVSLKNDMSFSTQISAFIEAIPLTAEEWQTKPILVNPPGFSGAALVLFAELHGRMGYFPSIIRIRPVEGGLVQAYEVAEIINLQDLRNKSRKERGRE